MPERTEPGTENPTQQPTSVRLLIVALATATSVVLYLDRFCVSFAADFIKEDLQLTQEQMGYFLSAFFFSYALAQVPAGWLSDRYGSRIMLAIYILVWSFFTALIGAVHSFAMLLITRLACGLGQAGAYPTCASVLSKWVPFRRRGTASAWISLGGRLGGAIAPLLTAFLIVQFVPVETPNELQPQDLRNAKQLCAKLAPLSANASPNQIAPTAMGQRVFWMLDEETQAAVIRGAALHRQGDKSAQLDEADRNRLVAGLNHLIHSVNLYDEQALGSINLPREAISSLKKIQSGESLTEAERNRFHRLLLESAFPNEIAKIYVRGWRPVMYVYGGVGIVLAALVWWVFRNRPEAHPWCNRQECELIEAGRPTNSPSPHGKADRIPLKQLLKSRSMWLACFSQLGTNIGWVFLVTWLPRYLLSEHHVPVLERGVMAMVPLLVGITGLYGGGWLTDLLAERLGVRWGRRLPMVLTRFTAAGGYVLCLWFSSYAVGSTLNQPWMYVAAFALVAFATDMGLPAAWAFNQDVGGRYVGSILGWGNMWGNLGASFSPIIYNHYLGETPGPAEWNAMFYVCMGAFLFSGLCCFGIDASEPIAPPDDISAITATEDNPED